MTLCRRAEVGVVLYEVVSEIATSTLRIHWLEARPNVLHEDVKVALFLCCPSGLGITRSSEEDDEDDRQKGSENHR
jgi:hypothetical protein